MASEIETPLGFGRADHTDIVLKFGRSSNVGTSFAPVSIGNIYRTPQPAAATALRIKAGNANDTAAGSGAREVTLIGMDETGAEVTEVIATAGASASSATAATFIRLYRAYVSKSGTYATAAAGSHAADIVVENAAGTEDWATIGASDFPKGQTEIGSYTVPLGMTAWISEIVLHVDSSKSVDIILFQRAGVLDTAAPYSAMRLVKNFVGVNGVFTAPLPFPLRFGELTDVGFMAKVATGSADVSVDMDMVVV